MIRLALCDYLVALNSRAIPLVFCRSRVPRAEAEEGEAEEGEDKEKSMK